MSAMSISQALPLRQVYNFRDLGGHPTLDGRTVRTGVVFRADGLHRLVEDDREVLAGIGLRTIVDLRTVGEIERTGHATPEVTDAVVRHLPLIQEIWDHDDLEAAGPADVYLAARYLEMLEEGPEVIRETIRLIIEEGPVVFHCAAGKDRTGVIAALILALVGVDHAAIAADYAASAAAVERFGEWIREQAADPDNDLITPEALDAMTRQPPAFMACPPEAMFAFLEAIDHRWGSVRDLALSLGLAEADLDALEATLLI